MLYAQTARRSIGFAALASSLSAAAPATAQEFCVACTGPDALYRCVLDRAAPSGIPLKFLCIQTLARQGGHAACSVRSGTVFDCDAPIRRIDASSGAVNATVPPAGDAPEHNAQSTPPTAIGYAPEPRAATSQEDATAPGGVHRDELARDRPEPSQPDQPDQPDTVEKLAKSISRSSKEALVKAGEGIKSTTQKTWDCVASLFKSC